MPPSLGRQSRGFGRACVPHSTISILARRAGFKHGFFDRVNPKLLVKQFTFHRRLRTCEGRVKQIFYANHKSRSIEREAP